MLTSLIVGLTLSTATHSGISSTPVRTFDALGGYIPLTLAMPVDTTPSSTITVSVTIAEAHSASSTLSLSTNQPGMFSSLPLQVTIPAFSTTGTFQATFNASALGNVSIAATNAAGTITGEITVSSDSLKLTARR